MRRVVVRAAAILVCVAVALALADVLGVVCLRYPRIIENQPLHDPIRVVAVDGMHIQLADGHDFELRDAGAYARRHLNDLIAASGGFVELEEVGGQYIAYVKHRGWVCGTPYAALIQIPLLADPVDVNTKALLGFGTLTVSQMQK